MASRDKADLKAAMADEVLADFDRLLESGERKKHGAKAVRRKLDDVMIWLHEYRQRIDAALDDGTFQADARDDVLAVFTDIVSYVNKEHRLALEEDAAVDPFLAGIRRAQLVVQHRRDAELARAERSEQDEVDDEAWEAAVHDRDEPQGGQPIEDDAAPDGAPEPAPAPKPRKPRARKPKE